MKLTMIGLLIMALFGTAINAQENKNAFIMNNAFVMNIEDERAKGNLDREPANLIFTDEMGVTTILGRIDKHNIIHWDEKVSIEILKRIIQGQQDFTMIQMNLYRPR